MSELDDTQRELLAHVTALDRARVDLLSTRSALAHETQMRQDAERLSHEWRNRAERAERELDELRARTVLDS